MTQTQSATALGKSQDKQQDNQASQDVRGTMQTSTTQANVLTRIVDTKAAHIAALKLRFPEASLVPKVSDRSLFAALKAPKAGYILECKKASPSKGLIRKDFDVEAIASIYTKYAAGISVLTDEQFFQGDMDYIPKVRAKVSQPILCKDFFVDEYQVKLAAHQGADAILLMLSVLDDERYQQLASEAAKYQLDVLTEISNEEELKRAIALNAPIIGINNRNLRDLSTDLATTEALAPHIGSDRVVISESGIYTNDQVRRLSPLVDGFLVGSSIMAEEDIDLACRKLIFGHNKVCGLTRLEDIEAAANAGAVYAGLIFAEKSPRALTKDAAKQLVEQYRAAKLPAIEFVGVFVNNTPKLIASIAKACDLAAVQLHGSETELEITELSQLLQQAGLKTHIWKAVSVDATSGELGAMPKGVQRYLFDSKNNAGFGGTGQPFNWHLPLAHKAKALLAGGLNAANAANANAQGFYGLDFNSGLETAPGIKSAEQIQTAFAQLRL
ncbi:bifunctional indole-3-glycerol-phosphate synthase TrpC/phosphoribosylanthranilate isomerase TrpF [Shewanella oneidensis MR-1]|uniref:Multifunctional fusion protein n=2 Tax=Shewanella oneidensis TaxID=70863 RepID=Q8ECV1_SHEON|nr:bifunctional indole-3-glycerolphosphate synthetase/phosphoribosylanthranilate isomerase TrpCF [Shewanella oneidensis MR-1]MEE2027395.1 Tryptophan biosynthesis protein TrpCF [Shewanella oneidensis]QKG97474.1 bifunctional indole-3-glycerol-phosphate synthase TrpC/phosphoribosylanthranilate isomerase TrpF [Shewanella oneidensis MR-1]